MAGHSRLSRNRAERRAIQTLPEAARRAQAARRDPRSTGTRRHSTPACIVIQPPAGWYRGSPRTIELVVEGLSRDPDTDWLFANHGAGIMVVEPRVFGRIYAVRQIRSSTTQPAGSRQGRFVTHASPEPSLRATRWKSRPTMEARARNLSMLAFVMPVNP